MAIWHGTLGSLRPDFHPPLKKKFKVPKIQPKCAKKILLYSVKVNKTFLAVCLWDFTDIVKFSGDGWEVCQGNATNSCNNLTCVRQCPIVTYNFHTVIYFKVIFSTRADRIVDAICFIRHTNTGSSLQRNKASLSTTSNPWFF